MGAINLWFSNRALERFVEQNFNLTGILSRFFQLCVGPARFGWRGAYSPFPKNLGRPDYCFAVQLFPKNQAKNPPKATPPTGSWAQKKLTSDFGATTFRSIFGVNKKAL